MTNVLVVMAYKDGTSEIREMSEDDYKQMDTSDVAEYHRIPQGFVFDILPRAKYTSPGGAYLAIMEAQKQCLDQAKSLVDVLETVAHWRIKL